MRLRTLLPLVIALFLLACHPADVPPMVTPTVKLNPPTAMVEAPTKAPILTQTLPPTLTDVPPTPTVSLTPVPAWQLCSPLAEQSLAEIPEIVSDPYSPPPPGKEERHHGVDLAYYQRKDRSTIEGEIVQAILPGKVILVIQDQLPYGNMVLLETLASDLPPALAADLGIAPGESLYHLYAHFRSSPLVQEGQWVDCGQALGEVGATGYNIVNPHLHLETRLGPASTDFSGGMAYYSTRTTEQERTNYEIWRTSGEFRHFDPMILIEFYLGN
jgi:murein DD-endopeptidase MepM/ murein hydrolase activator NlpD